MIAGIGHIKPVLRIDAQAFRAIELATATSRVTECVRTHFAPSAVNSCTRSVMPYSLVKMSPREFTATERGNASSVRWCHAFPIAQPTCRPAEMVDP